MITVNVKLFAAAKDIAGAGEVRLSLPDGSLASEVIEALIKRNLEFLKWKKYLRLAVNREYINNDQPLHDNDEVAVIPPVSGG